MGLKRVLTALVAIPLLYVIVWHLPPGYFALLIAAAAAVGQHELYRMAVTRGITPAAIPGMVLGVLLVINFLSPLLPDLGVGFFIVASVMLVLLIRLFAPRPVDGALADVAVTVLGLFYVALFFAYQVGIRMGPDGKRWLAFLYLVIWASDTAAYYAGTAWGKHRLYEKISPKKSIEGLVAGVTGAVAVALLCRAWFMPPITVQETVFLGIVLTAAGTLGDLAESLIKRGAGVKDSGTLIPGHGGVLDRMDSMLFAAPALFYYLAIR
jgi:phosphatidate cytidylyltransferase